MLLKYHVTVAYIEGRIMLFYWLELARDVGLDRFLGLVACVSVHVIGSTIPTYLAKPYISSFDNKRVSTMLS